MSIRCFTSIVYYYIICMEATVIKVILSYNAQDTWLYIAVSITKKKTFRGEKTLKYSCNQQVKFNINHSR